MAGSGRKLNRKFGRKRSAQEPKFGHPNVGPTRIMRQGERESKDPRSMAYIRPISLGKYDRRYQPRVRLSCCAR